MPKKRPAVESREDALHDLNQIVARLDRVDAVLNQIELRLEPLLVLPVALAEARSVALEALAQAQDAQAVATLARVHEDRLNNLTLAVAEGIQHVERAEARIRATVRRAREELQNAGLAALPSLEAEASTLRLGDDGGGGGGELPAVRAPVAQDVTAYDDRTPSAVPGMTKGELRRYRGA